MEGSLNCEMRLYEMCAQIHFKKNVKLGERCEVSQWVRGCEGVNEWEKDDVEEQGPSKGMRDLIALFNIEIIIGQLLALCR